MPTYQFRCGDCGNMFLCCIRYSDYETTSPHPICTKCLSENIRQVYSPIQIIYKSDGFTKKVGKNV
jgi:putative FmdB family regulatory protein